MRLRTLLRWVGSRVAPGSRIAQTDLLPMNFAYETVACNSRSLVNRYDHYKFAVGKSGLVPCRHSKHQLRELASWVSPARSPAEKRCAHWQDGRPEEAGGADTRPVPDERFFSFAFRCVAPHFAIAVRAGTSVQPYGVSEYSTCSDLFPRTKRDTIFSRSRARSCAVKTFRLA